ncbi:MAG: hypothetical protein KKD13_00940, partial [Candidatus Margulisbacteria bacterium]|nr:hypothetical protein [Candidatus Margulisiibacteriota bacterium]
MNKPKYSISKQNEFVIGNYNQAPTFSSFFPGIAGIFGCPMWVFYANRGQCIASAGVQDKNGAIIEFHAANKAYRNAHLQGFRTFLKVDGQFYEPFAETSPCQNELRINPYDIKLIEENPDLKIRVEVHFFNIPDEHFPALARTVKIVNLGKKARQVEVVDGLPIIIPFGFEDFLLKKMSQTIEAWCIVENLDQGVPFYKLKVLPADNAETKLLKKGNFYLPFCQDGQPVATIVDPTVVFGENSSLERPDNFLGKSFKVPGKQMTDGFTPAAFAHKKFTLTGDFELSSIIGQIDSLDLLNNDKPRLMSRSYLEAKAAANQNLINGIGDSMDIRSASRSFDLYSRYTFLDNVMRGGLPLMIGGKPIYLYYRKHGDMERDYNDFKLMPTYFSQGNGNYRDINQNRRNDLFFNPEIKESNIVRFFNLIQLDGFNPLVVLGSKYFIESYHTAETLAKKHLREPEKQAIEKIARPFILGELLKEFELEGVQYQTTREAFASDLLQSSEVEEGAVHGEGFWIDHPFYNTDLLESFEAVYPDRITDVLFNQKNLTFFDNDHVVVPRQEKYKLCDGKVRQYESVKLDPEKAALINHRAVNKNAVRVDHGKGKIYHTTLAAKLLCLIANKAATFDAAGIGLEMEADKPDWYDALNGLPGLLGSSLSETLELKRVAAYLLLRLENGKELVLPAEVKEFIDHLLPILAETDSHKYWETTYQLKEKYRQKIKLGIAGSESAIGPQETERLLGLVIARCDQAVEKVLSKYGNYYTYFVNEVSSYEELGQEIRVKGFCQSPLPLFLEGFVHALKVERDASIYQRVKESPLFDKKLKMYKVNAPLTEMPVEIGRTRIFAPGWLENESVFVHMEYKYLLELLKAGLYKEFFTDFKNVLVPFMDPRVYKRSILENSSFIVSSAHPNAKNHGRGFIARLSGGAAEFIDMWLTMTTGKRLFFLDQTGKLCFQLKPVLPAWLFKQGELSFRLFGKIEVVYLNSKRKDSFDKLPLSYKLFFDDKEIEIAHPII